MVDDTTVDFGCDIDSSWTATNTGDLKLISGVDNAEQAIYNRLMTKLNELDYFGYINYGNQSYDAMGMTDLKTAEQVVILYTTNCLKIEPRVERVNNVSVDFKGAYATVNANIKLIGVTNTNNLVFNIGDEV